MISSVLGGRLLRTGEQYEVIEYDYQTLYVRIRLQDGFESDWMPLYDLANATALDEK